MVYLFVFISGILFAEIIIPVLGTLLEYAETRKEVFISNQSVIVAKNNSKIKKLNPEDQPPVSAIGFECPPMDSDDEEYYEDNHAKNERRAGFHD